jgi:hypothetical protein
MKTIPQQRSQFGWLLLIAVIAGAAGLAKGGTTNPVPALPQGQTPEHVLSKTDKVSDWKDPDKVLPEVVYDNLPITEVAEDLKRKFGGEFDVLLPFGTAVGQNWDWTAVSVVLRLKNAKASEIFNAMNMVFETAKTPVHWELTMNGHRPTALLHILHEDAPIAAIDPTTGLPLSAKPIERPMVFFVGDLVGEPKSGGMTIEQVVQTVSEVCRFALAGDHISSHKQAQLLIVRGTDDDIKFVQSTLAALREKARLDTQRIGRDAHQTQLLREAEKGQSEGDQGTQLKTGNPRGESGETKTP